MNFDLKNGCKNEFKDDNENHAADTEIRFSQNRFQSAMATQRPCRQRGS